MLIKKVTHIYTNQNCLHLLVVKTIKGSSTKGWQFYIVFIFTSFISLRILNLKTNRGQMEI